MPVAAWRKGVAEFIGAFTLIFIGAGAIISTGGTGLVVIALAHGLAIGGMASAFARFSRGPFNAAGTLGPLAGRRMPLRRPFDFWVSPLVAATGAAMNPARWFGRAIVAEFFDNWYVYWIGPFIGAIVAGLLYANVFLEKPR